MSAGRCTARTKEDTRCHMRVWRGSDTHCWVHDPEIEEQRRKAHQRGAAVTNRRFSLGRPPTDHPPETIEEARRWLSWLAMLGATDGDVSSTRISAIRHTLRDLIQAVEKSTLEARIQELEALLDEHGLDA